MVVELFEFSPTMVDKLFGHSSLKIDELFEQSLAMVDKLFAHFNNGD